MAETGKEVRLCWKTVSAMLGMIFLPDGTRLVVDMTAVNTWLDAAVKLGQVVVAIATAIYFIRKSKYAKRSKKRSPRARD